MTENIEQLASEVLAEITRPFRSIHNPVQKVKTFPEAHRAKKAAEDDLTEALRFREALFQKTCLISETNYKGNITYVNDVFCEVTGYTQAELLGKPHNILRHADMPKKTFREMWKRLKSGSTWRGILKNRKKDGTSFWGDITISPAHGVKGLKYISLCFDITFYVNLIAKYQKRALELEAELRLNTIN